MNAISFKYYILYKRKIKKDIIEYYNFIKFINK